MKTTKQLREQKELKLANFLGYKTAKKEGAKCSGNWAGTTDYYLVFEDGTTMGICNGMSNYIEVLDKYIEKYSNFYNNQELIFQELAEIKKRDDKIADELGLKKYEIIDVGISKRDLFGWAYLKLKVNDKIIYKIETSLSSALLNNMRMDYNNELYRNKTSKYYVAGGLDKADYCFNGVGFNSESSLYNIREVGIWNMKLLKKLKKD